RDAHRLVGRFAASGVRKDPVAVPVDDVEDRLLLGIVEVEPPQSDGDQLASGGFQRGEHQLVGRVFAGPDEQARVELDAGDLETVRARSGLHAPSLPAGRKNPGYRSCCTRSVLSRLYVRRLTASSMDSHSR